MRPFLCHASLLLLGFAWYQFGQRLLRKGYRDEKGELTQGLAGPAALLVAAAVACFLFFFMLRALIRRDAPCITGPYEAYIIRIRFI